MTGNRRSDVQIDIEAMTRDFLQKGGKVVQCPPGPSETVVYRSGTFRRRSQTQSQGQTEATANAPASAQADAAADPAK